MFSFFFFSSRRRHTRWNCDWSSDVCSSDLRHSSLYETLAEVYRVEPAEGEETIETVLAGPHDARLLCVDVGLPLLLLSRHAFDRDGKPLEWAQSWYRGDRYKFVTRLRRRPPSTGGQAEAPAGGQARGASRGARRGASRRAGAVSSPSTGGASPA